MSSNDPLLGVTALQSLDPFEGQDTPREYDLHFVQNHRDATRSSAKAAA